MRRANRHILLIYHPAVIFLYFCGAIALTMMTYHPLYVVLSFVAASAYNIYLKGYKSYLRSFRYALLVVILVTAFNALFNGLGETELFSLKETRITLEALVFGLCSGGMLVSILLWFSNYQVVMTTDRFLCLFGKWLPSISMMICMILRLVPEMVYRAGLIREARHIVPRKESRRARTIEGVRMASILMGWSMENSLEASDSMQARGYGAKRRTSFQNYTMGMRDWLVLSVLIPLFAWDLSATIQYTGAYLFYPYLGSLGVGWIVPSLHALLLFFPLLLEGVEQISWLRLR